MSVLTNTFTDIANAIRAKTSTTITYKPTEMANAINNIETAIVYNSNGNAFSYVFNYPVIIDNSVTSTYNLFYGFKSFNQPIMIPNGVTNTANMFVACFSFNQPVTIPNGVTNMYYMFFRCSNLNQPVTIPNSVTNMALCFNGCSNFNQPITISSSVTNMYGIFQYCNNFNQSVTIPSSVTNLKNAFFYCLPLMSSTSTIPVHISSSIAIGNTSNYIYNALANGYTAINWTGRILNDA